ncbi:MAG: hypothetical protein LBE91_17400 [Tannerella sp.]|nr:hypothetical protein [Tannerella sp.]
MIAENFAGKNALKGGGKGEGRGAEYVLLSPSQITPNRHASLGVNG